MKTKIDAIIMLLEDSRSEKLSYAAYRRANSACRSLGLTNGESEIVLDYLGFHDKGKPLPWLRDILDAKEAKKVLQ